MQDTTANKIDNTAYAACLSQLNNAIPNVLKYIDTLPKHRTAAEYSNALHIPVSPLQDNEDLIYFAEKKAAELFDKQTARALRKELEKRFIAMTANHHGMDFHPEFLQGNLIFAQGCQYAVPLFAWGGVPGDNASFARGMLASPRTNAGFKPHKIPLFSNADRRIFINQKSAYTGTQIQNSLKRLSKYDLSPQEEEKIKELLADIYSNQNVLAQKDFKDQMSLANFLLWRKLFPEEPYLPLVSLELQSLAANLVIKDLQNPTTLIAKIITEKELTKEIYFLLDSTRSCWTVENEQIKKGSFLFWAVDEKKRSLRLNYSQEKNALFCPENPKLFFPLNAQTIAKALRGSMLLPSLYLTFAATAMARGLNCAGGIFQFEYLPDMAKQTARALLNCGEQSLASKISAQSPLCTGFLPLQTCTPFSENMHETVGAGALEMLIHGGLTKNILQKLAETKIKEAFLSALAYHYEDLINPQEYVQDWKKNLFYPAPITL